MLKIYFLILLFPWIVHAKLKIEIYPEVSVEGQNLRILIRSVDQTTKPKQISSDKKLGPNFLTVVTKAKEVITGQKKEVRKSCRKMDITEEDTGLPLYWCEVVAYYKIPKRKSYEMELLFGVGGSPEIKAVESISYSPLRG